MIILVEGADGTGKSTLARDLSDRYGLDYLKFVVPDEHPMDYWFRNGLANITKPTVIDRLHLSEEAYGPVFRDGSALSPLDFWAMEGFLWARRTVLIMCSTSWERMLENQAKAKGEYHGDRQRDVVVNFGDLLSKTSLPLNIYDYTVPLTRQLTYQTIEAVHNQSGEVDPTTAGMGNARPKYWFVGEQPTKVDDGRPLQYRMCFHSPAGDYLRRTLDSMYIRWNSMWISNSLDWEGNPYDLSAEYERLGRPKVVALGRIANEELNKADVPHNGVRHPQSWRRFDYHNMEGYADAIRIALDR